MKLVSKIIIKSSFVDYIYIGEHEYDLHEKITFDNEKAEFNFIKDMNVILIKFKDLNGEYKIENLHLYEYKTTYEFEIVKSEYDDDDDDFENYYYVTVNK